MCFPVADSNATQYLAQSNAAANEQDQRWLNRLTQYGPQEVYSPDLRRLQDEVYDESLLLGKRTNKLEQELSPDVYATRKGLESQVRSDLEDGGQLTDAIQREAMKAGLIQALGSGTSGSGAGDATVANVLGRAVINRRDINQAKAGAFLNANKQPIAGISPADIAGITNQIGQGYVDSRNMYKTGLQGNELGVNNASNDRWQQALSASIKEAINNANAVNQGNANSMKFYTDMASSIAGAAGGAAACWVAREVYGRTNPKWLKFHYWLFNHAPWWIRGIYVKFGERFASWISNKPKIKKLIKGWMDKKINSLNK